MVYLPKDKRRALRKVRGAKPSKERAPAEPSEPETVEPGGAVDPDTVASAARLQAQLEARFADALQPAGDVDAHESGKTLGSTTSPLSPPAAAPFAFPLFRGLRQVVIEAPEPVEPVKAAKTRLKAPTKSRSIGRKDMALVCVSGDLILARAAEGSGGDSRPGKLLRLGPTGLPIHEGPGPGLRKPARPRKTKRLARRASAAAPRPDGIAKFYETFGHRRFPPVKIHLEGGVSFLPTGAAKAPLTGDQLFAKKRDRLGVSSRPR